MKSFYTSKALILIMSLTFWACSEDIDNPNNTNRESSGTSNRFVATVGMPDATQESLKSAQTTTKVNLANDASTPRNLYETWAEGDQIALFFINDDGTIIAGEKVTISNISSDGKGCYFEGEIPLEISATFTIVGVVGMDDVTVSDDGTEIIALAEPRPFKANNNNDKIPMMFQYKVETRDASGTTTIQALFERVGTIEHVYLQNKLDSDITITNIEMTSPDETNNLVAWYYTATQSEVPQVELLSGTVTMVAGTPASQSMATTSVSSGTTQSFIKWVMPIENVQKPEVKIKLTTSSGNITSFNSNKIPGVSHNINVQKQRIYTEVVQLSTVNSKNFLEFLHPYIIQTDGGTSANAYIASLEAREGVKHMDLEGNIHGFTGLTESEWFSGLTKVISYGSEITTLLYQASEEFAIDAQLTPRITSLAEVFAGGAATRYPGIEKWNTQYVTNMSNMFDGAFQFNQPIGGWDVSKVTNMTSMFTGATTFNQDISGWTVSNVKYMNGMFRGATTFNQDISGWTVSNVTEMAFMFSGATNFNNGATSSTQSKPLNWGNKTSKVINTQCMFQNATNFNQDISGWNVGKVRNMRYMFDGARAFNQDISGWNVSNVTDMFYMFSGATNFNNGATSSTQSKPLSWGDKTAKVEHMQGMFFGATNFNQDISGWNVGNVTNMAFMFRNATNFNQDIGKWNVSKVTNMESMFYGATSFYQDLSGWCVQKISTMPDGFDGSAFTDDDKILWESVPAGFYGQTALQPQWGTCPGK